MRCSEVIHELAAPTQDRDAHALEAHLAECASCSLWAQRDADLNRLWDATRPATPPPATWAQVWSRVSESLEPATLKRSAAPSRGRKLARFALVVLAQAAAVLLVVGVSWRSVPPAHQAPPAIVENSAHHPAASGVQEQFVEIDEGRVVLIRVEATSQDVVRVASVPIDGGVDDWFVLFNDLESLATTPVVAME